MATHDLPSLPTSKKLRETVDQAIAGNADAQDKVGQLFHYGIEVEKNPAEALRWFKLAADQGHAAGQRHVATALERDNRELPDARNWLERAAANGDVEACYDLGRFLRDGIGGPVDRKRARSWFEKAASGGSKAATRAIADMVREVEPKAKTASRPQRELPPPQLPDISEDLTAYFLAASATGQLQSALARARDRFQWTAEQVDVAGKVLQDLASLPHARVLALRDRLVGQWKNASTSEEYERQIKYTTTRNAKWQFDQGGAYVLTEHTERLSDSSALIRSEQARKNSLQQTLARLSMGPGGHIIASNSWSVTQGTDSAISRLYERDARPETYETRVEGAWLLDGSRRILLLRKDGKFSSVPFEPEGRLHLRIDSRPFTFGGTADPPSTRHVSARSQSQPQTQPAPVVPQVQQTPVEQFTELARTAAEEGRRPQAANALLKLGLAHGAEKNVAAEKQAYTDAAQLGSNSGPNGLLVAAYASFNLAIVFRNEQDLAAEKAALADAVRYGRASLLEEGYLCASEAAYRLGLRYQQAKDNTGASAAFDDALNLGKKSKRPEGLVWAARAWTELATGMAEAGDFEGAKAALEAAAAWGKGSELPEGEILSARSSLGLALLLANNSQLDGARAALGRARRLLEKQSGNEAQLLLTQVSAAETNLPQGEPG